MPVSLITPTGDAATDISRWNTAVASINKLTAGRSGTIMIAGNGKPLNLDGSGATSTTTFTRGAFIRGESPAAMIKLNNRFQINWGGFSEIDDYVATAVAFAGVEANRASFPQISPALVRGDWILMWSDDVIVGADRHSDYLGTKPAELHKVDHIAGSVVVLDRPVVDRMMTNPKLKKLTMMTGCGIADVNIMDDDPTDSDQNTRASLDIQNTVGFIMENVNWLEQGPGCVRIDQSARTRICGFNGHKTRNNFYDYGLVTMICHDLKWCDSSWNGSRHVFTTSGHPYGGYRFGTPTEIVVDNVSVNHAGDSTNNSYFVFDTHPEGYGVEFRNCSVTASGATKAIHAFNARARAQRHINCKVTGSYTEVENRSGHTGVWLRAEGCEVRNCDFRRIWKPILISTGMETGAVFGNYDILDNYFENCDGPAITSTINSNNLYISRNNVVNCGWGTVEPYAFRLQGGTGHRITYNNLHKYSGNSHSIHGGAVLQAAHLTVCSGNMMTGYGANLTGMGGLAALNTTFASRNYTSA